METHQIKTQINSEGKKDLTHSDLEVLSAPFPKEKLGVKIQTFNKERNRAMLVLYLQHTDVQERLEQVDPGWTSEVLNEKNKNDAIYVRLRMTLKGASRENIGEGTEPKAAYSDALKRCAMLFGVGRFLYDSETVWVDYQESRDRHRHWSLEDYENAKRPIKIGLKTEPLNQLKTPQKNTKPRTELNRMLMNLYRPFLVKFPDTRFVELLQSKYQVTETRLMTLEQLEDLVEFMEEKLKSVA